MATHPAAIDPACDAANAAWAAVQAAWVGSLLNALVVGSAFGAIVFQRILDQRKREQQRQYLNLSTLIEVFFLADYLDVMADYIGAAILSNKLVSKYPIRFYVGGAARILDKLTSANDLGPGPASLASFAIGVGDEVTAKMNAVCADTFFTASELQLADAFMTSLQPATRDIWFRLTNNYRNVAASPDGAWACEQFTRRHRSAQEAQDVLSRIRQGRRNLDVRP